MRSSLKSIDEKPNDFLRVGIEWIIWGTMRCRGDFKQPRRKERQYRGSAVGEELSSSVGTRREVNLRHHLTASNDRKRERERESKRKIKKR